MLYTEYTPIVSLLLFGTIVSGSSIIPGAIWTDTAGKPIQAHEGSITKHGDIWYWFGVNDLDIYSTIKTVRVYSSIDLVTWTFLGDCLSISSADSRQPIIIGGPKVIYNEHTGKFVMWFHMGDITDSVAKLGVAYAVEIDGPYQYLGSVSPFGEDSRRVTIWKEPYGAACAIYSSKGNTNAVIAALSSDYLTLESKVHEFEDVGWESFALFKANGKYRLIASSSNRTKSERLYHTSSSSLKGPWTVAAGLPTHAISEYQLSTTDVIEVTNKSFIWMTDSVNSTSLSDHRYVWLPIELSSDGRLDIPWRREWWLDSSTGNHGLSHATRFECEDSTAATLSGGTSIISCSTCSNGLAVSYVGFDGTLVISPIIVSKSAEYSVVIGYINGDSWSREVMISVNGVHKMAITFPSTGSWDNVDELVVRLELHKGGNAIQLYNIRAYAPTFDYIKVPWY